MQIEDGDELIAVKLTSGRDNIFLASHEGMAIRFPESDVRGMGRTAYGVNAMDLDKGDYIVGMEIVGEKELILSVTEKGYGKRTAIVEYRLQSRAGKGVINVKTTERNGKVVNVLPRHGRVGSDDHLAARQNHAPRFQHHSRERPLRPGRAPD